MTERELISQWTSARWHIIVSQLAPTFLLVATVWLLAEGLADAPLAVKLAAAGILLASGILGSVAQFTAASEGLAAIDDLVAQSGTLSRVGARIAGSAIWFQTVRFVTPTIFVLIYVAILAALFVPGAA